MKVEIADNYESREFGLMDRKTLDKDSGMLFVFDNPDHLGFWGKKTYIPLDIAFITADKKISSIRKIRKKAQVWDFIVEKSKGLYEKIRNIFKGDEAATQQAVETFQEDEQQDLFEQNLGRESIAEALESNEIPDKQLDQEYLDEYTSDQMDAVESIGDTIKIAYTTYYTNFYMNNLTITPLYTKYAKTTGNNILVSWCHDVGDFRAFVIPNISKPTEESLI
jgi:uncharacterized membrane protein (UPF0127 family)